MAKRIKLDESSRKRIEEAVQNAEKKTSGEIVPIFVSASGSYPGIHFLGALAGYLLGSFAGLSWMNSQWHATVWDLLLTQTGGAALGMGLPLISGFKRLLLPRKWTARRVEEIAFFRFVTEGLTHTRDRTGVLIYVSQLEHRVVILADRGIDQKVPKGYWDTEIQKLIAGIRSGEMTSAFVEVITDIGNKLSENFPRSADDINELPDRLR